MASRFQRIFRTLVLLIPEIKQPQRKLSFRTRLYFTAFVFLIYATFNSIPIFSSVNVENGDPFAFMRTITATNQGSLAELVIAPILTAGLLMQILIGLKIIDINLTDQEGHHLYNKLMKVLAILITIIFALMTLIGGIYGDPNILGIDGQLIVIIQLIITGIIFIYLDEIIQKGWGFGSGIALFIACNIGLSIFTALFSVQPILEGSSNFDLAVTSNRGIFVALFAWLSDKGLIEAIQSLFFRYDPENWINLPSLSIFSLIITVIVFIFIIFMESIDIETPISYNENEEVNPTYPIKLLYFSIIPIILVYTLLANINFIAQFVWNISGKENSTNLLATLLGMFERDISSGQLVPISGLAYFITSPNSFIGEFGFINPSDPLSSIIKSFIYSIIVIGLCVSFTTICIRVNKEITRNYVSNLLKDEFHDEGWENEQENMINAFTDDIHKVALIGGFVIGVIIAFTACFSPLGTGIGIILFTSIVRQYIEMIVLKKPQVTGLVKFYLTEE